MNVLLIEAHMLHHEQHVASSELSKAGRQVYHPVQLPDGLEAGQVHWSRHALKKPENYFLNSTFEANRCYMQSCPL